MAVDIIGVRQCHQTALKLRIEQDTSRAPAIRQPSLGKFYKFVTTRILPIASHNYLHASLDCIFSRSICDVASWLGKAHLLAQSLKQDTQRKYILKSISAVGKYQCPLSFQGLTCVPKAAGNEIAHRKLAMTSTMQCNAV